MCTYCTPPSGAVCQSVLSHSPPPSSSKHTSFTVGSSQPIFFTNFFLHLFHQNLLLCTRSNKFEFTNLYVSHMKTEMFHGLFPLKFIKMIYFLELFFIYLLLLFFSIAPGLLIRMPHPSSVMRLKI